MPNIRNTLLAISIALSANAAASNTPIATKVRSVIAKMHKNAHIGILVKSLKNQKTIYSKNANALFAPASIQKIVTSAAALILLKPSYQFNTTLAVAKNNLYLKFSGDPTLTDNDLNALIKHLKNKHITSIKGNLIVDTSDYNTVPYPPGFLWDDLSYDFAAPLKTIIVDDNKFGVTFAPGNKAGKKPTLSDNMPKGTIRISNNLETITRYKKHCPITIYSNAFNQYEINGCLLKKQGKQYRTLAIRDPYRVLKAVLLTQLKDNNIHLSGTVRLGKTPTNAKVISIHKSKPLKTLIKHLLKTSDNLYTNTLVKKIGQNYYHTQGSWQNGLRATKRILSSKAGIKVKKIRINDGAGLSRYDLLSPSSMVKLLCYINNDRTLKKIFWHALPIAGVDGTLRGRMASLAKNKRLRAKTGTMTSASSLAGFAKNRKYGELAFAIMINGYVGKKTPFMRLENKIGLILANAK